MNDMTPARGRSPARYYSHRPKAVNRWNLVAAAGRGGAAPPRSLHGLDAEVLGNRRDLGALLLGGGRELGRAADIEQLSGGGEARLDGRIGGDGANVGGDALAE